MLYQSYREESSIKSSMDEWEQKITRYYNISNRAKHIELAKDSQLELLCDDKLTEREIKLIHRIVSYINNNK